MCARALSLAPAPSPARAGPDRARRAFRRAGPARRRTDHDDATLYMNDLHILDTSCKPPAWSRPPRMQGNPPPIEREGHTAVVVGARMVVFGGTWVDEEDNSRYLNDVHVFDTARNWWSQPDVLGTPPLEREGHTASVVGRNMLVFGGAGLDGADRSINLADLHVLDTGSWTWHEPALGSAALPQERRYHTACVLERALYVFGGQYYEPSADLHFECDNVVSRLDTDAMAWETLQVDGQAPLRRACHSASVVGKQIFIVGGRYWDISEDDYIFMNDVQILDMAPCSSLAADWRAYLRNEHLSDLELRVDGRCIPAHRVVLAARCEHFARMLLSGMQEVESGRVQIDGVRHEVFLCLLEYLYTDVVEFAPEIALELLTAADRFGLERLKHECTCTIEASLCTGTVCQVLPVADQHSALDLKAVSARAAGRARPEVLGAWFPAALRAHPPDAAPTPASRPDPSASRPPARARRSACTTSRPTSPRSSGPRPSRRCPASCSSRCTLRWPTGTTRTRRPGSRRRCPSRARTCSTARHSGCGSSHSATAPPPPARRR